MTQRATERIACGAYRPASFKQIVMLACYDRRSLSLSLRGSIMKKVVLTLVAAAAGFMSMSSAFANDHHHHECHKVHVHHHWEKRCH